MKKFGRIVLWAVCAFLLVLIPLQFLASIHDQEMAARPSLTQEDLDRLAPTLSSSPQAEDGPPDSEPLAAPETPLPRRLERALTSEEQAKYWTSVFGRNQTMGRFAYSTLGIFDAPLRAVGFSQGASFERAKAALWAGDFDKARQQLSEYVRTADGTGLCHEALIDLALLEDDPELAARYMELSCTDENDLRGGYEAMAAWLAEKTGSKSLEAHYRAKLEAINQKRKKTGWQP